MHEKDSDPAAGASDQLVDAAALGQCERNPNCTRGFKHGGRGGHCSLKTRPMTKSTSAAPQSEVNHPSLPHGWIGLVVHVPSEEFGQASGRYYEGSVVKASGMHVFLHFEVDATSYWFRKRIVEGWLNRMPDKQPQYREHSGTNGAPAADRDSAPARQIVLKAPSKPRPAKPPAVPPPLGPRYTAVAAATAAMSGADAALDDDDFGIHEFSSAEELQNAVASQNSVADARTASGKGNEAPRPAPPSVDISTVGGQTYEPEEYCQICEGGQDEELMLLCDACNLGFRKAFARSNLFTLP